MNFCAALTPTRNSLTLLRRTLRSFFESANSPNLMQAVVKIDTDDHVKLDAIPKLKEEFPGFVPVISHRGAGYNDMWRFIQECENAANARWHFMLDDDAMLQGKGWDTQLYEMGAQTPIGQETFAAQAQFYRLGNCTYESTIRNSCTPVGLFVPAHFWKRLGVTQLASPADDAWQSTLLRHKWPIRPLQGVTYYHDHHIDSPHRHPDYVPCA